MVKSCFESRDRREDAVIPCKWITPGTHPSFHIDTRDRPTMRQKKYSDSTVEVRCLELDMQPTKPQSHMNSQVELRVDLFAVERAMAACTNSLERVKLNIARSTVNI